VADHDEGKPSLAIIIVSANSAHWLPACLSSVHAHRGDIGIDLVVVDSGCTDETDAVVAADGGARLVRSPNRGFAYANNRGIETTEASWILLLNPDTEIVAGTLGELVGVASARPEYGIFGARQTSSDGSLQYTIRRFPSPLRSLGESLGVESWPVRPGFLGERTLDPAAYDREAPCDWTPGSFMLIRRETLLGAGLLDERFFLFAEEVDLCLRARSAGWPALHLPGLTIVHHGGTESSDVRLAAQRAYSRRLYMEKHFSPPQRAAGIGAMAVGYALRAVVGGRDRSSSDLSRATSRAALATLLGKRPPPFGQPPEHAVRPLAR
jgi:N-acetylglucosaminyl-diphospho-decaprenol L-rhamnosyltransferase